jgi:hypothetical protein
MFSFRKTVCQSTCDIDHNSRHQKELFSPPVPQHEQLPCRSVRPTKQHTSCIQSFLLLNRPLSPSDSCLLSLTSPLQPATTANYIGRIATAAHILKTATSASHSPALSAGANTTSHAPTGHYRALQRPDRGDSSTHPIYSQPSLKEQDERYIQRPILHQKLFRGSAGLYQPTAARTTYTVYPFQPADAYLAPHASTSPVYVQSPVI